MSDGLSDANRELSATAEIHGAAEQLADALDGVRDAAFGFPPMTLEIANAVLRRVGLRLVER